MSTDEPGARPSAEDVAREVDELVDECRSTCLWYQRPDYYPRTDLERLRVLEAIQKHADLDTFRRAGRLKGWLSHRPAAHLPVASRRAQAVRRELRGHRKAKLDLDTLIDRYDEPRTQHVGSLEELQLGFVSLVDRLFGPEKAADVDRSLMAQPSRPVRSV